MKSLFISMEGPDGSGKSTQIELLKNYLSAQGYDIIITREPGGTTISEAIRNIILNRDYSEMSYTTEMFLYAAARAQLVEEVIKPALNSNKAVICDRFIDSSAVYQGIARGLGVENVYNINNYALNGISPDMTFLLDLDAEEGIKRKRNQAELDRMETEKIDFHRKVVEGYRMLAKRDPERIISIDATLPVNEINQIIINEVTKRIK